MYNKTKYINNKQITEFKETLIFQHRIQVLPLPYIYKCFYIFMKNNVFCMTLV